MKTPILVAEDDAVSRELLCSRLRRWGYAVIATSNGTDALAELEREDGPSVAILDYMLPGMEGLEIVRRVRASGRAVYLILLTSFANNENVIAGLAAGADDYLIKPLGKEMLQARVRSAVRLMTLESELAAAKQRIRELEGF